MNNDETKVFYILFLFYPSLHIVDSLYDFSLHVTLLLGQLFNGGSCIIELCGQTSYRCVAPHDSSSEVRERCYMMHL